MWVSLLQLRKVIFHPFHELIAVANGNSVGIWSLSNCTKLVQIHNDLPIPFCRNSSLSSQLHRVKPRALSGQFIQSQNSSTSLPSTVSGAPSPPLPPPLPPGSRITAMTWINESSESLLMVAILVRLFDVVTSVFLFRWAALMGL